MQFGDYPTPGDVRLYIGSSWVDDAYRVDFEEQNKKIPIFGYHEKFYGDVADGKVVTVGNLILHYRYPGYLTYAIKQIMDTRERSTIMDSVTRQAPGFLQPPPAPGSVGAVGPTQRSPRMADKSTFIATVQAVRKMSIADRVKALVGSFETGAFDQMSGLMRGLYADTVEGSSMRDSSLESSVEMGPSAYVQGQLGFDLTLYYGYVGTRNRGVYVTETLKGVHLTGRRKVINASTSGGDLSASGQTMLEVYPFFCRNVEPRIYDPAKGPPDFGA